MIKHFINLTNGIEFISELQEKGITDINFIRIESTTLERKDFIKLLNSLDSNLLMYLALGYKCYFYDAGTNRNFSKTCYLGVPLINYILSRRWTGNVPIAYRYSRSGKERITDVAGRSDWIYNFLFTFEQSDKAKRSMKRKIDYYKRYITNGKIGELIPISHSTSNDGNYAYYAKVVNENLKKEIR